MTRIMTDEVVEVPGEVLVTGDELHYLTRVRRHRPGDDVEVRSSRGRTYRATVTRIEPERAVLTVRDELAGASFVFPVTMLVAVPKRHLMDDIVRKLSEIGMARLVPLLSERSVVHPGDERVARWRRIARESLRQCGREIPLVVEDPTDLAPALRAVPESGTSLILHPRGAGRGLFGNGGGRDVPSPLTVAIGPEGGFTEDEVALAETLGFRPVTLPTPILRVETAAIACAVLSAALLA